MACLVLRNQGENKGSFYFSAFITHDTIIDKLILLRAPRQNNKDKLISSNNLLALHPLFPQVYSTRRTNLDKYASPTLFLFISLSVGQTNYFGYN